MGLALTIWLSIITFWLGNQLARRPLSLADLQAIVSYRDITRPVFTLTCISIGFTALLYGLDFVAREQTERPTASLSSYPLTAQDHLRRHDITLAGTLFGWQTERCIVVAGVSPNSANLIIDGTDNKSQLCVLGSAHDQSCGPTASTSRLDTITAVVSRTSSPEIMVEGMSISPVLYKVPNIRKHRFLSMTAISLKVTTEMHTPQSGEQSRMSARVERLLKTDFTASAQPVGCLEEALELVNRVSEIRRDLVRQLDSADRSNAMPRISQLGRWSGFLSPFAALSAIVKQLATTPLPGTSHAMSDLSAVVQQLDTRLDQTSSWLTEYRIMSRLERAHMREARARYINLYNMIWLVTNDVIIGLAAGSYLCENADPLACSLSALLQRWAFTSVKAILLWLTDWPAGLKLNKEMGQFFCEAFLYFTAAWETTALRFIEYILPSVIFLTGMGGFLGATTILSAFIDIIAVGTVHLYLFYLMAANIYRWHLHIIFSLFNIFRGKKLNVLRNRIEPAEYDLDQLLLGTILFTLAAFLFPTVLAFYLVFASCRLAVIVCYAVLETSIVFLNHFPLFAIILRLKDPARLPGGVQFELLRRGTLRIKNKPVSYADVFGQYVTLWMGLFDHYSPLPRKLLSGDMIKPIARPRLRHARPRENQNSKR
ncbi:uncharacterized protein L969DRAFT_93569 [Mixia osmundae IAM 14324]|uniref:Uncharacterized protein n=1 Tax=Mixia osmundae (strain CBS 9802 / IAM 14324 / JCM 22182 / KY 12970) TaxID=764103 RepID=G7DUC8_MIXOS|nr:uncharacterized protein L969DRAFT_93569 [Mixia osmundae IAM 14324]KEI41060.1 hypothetical protein L969DRAFT_93569 [Mixia osmundae IAM 14324]GAA94188.1 hypothetical protein E5Q_00836 [Mixia osmundae IAM 14324]